jgi:hypothetical protein
MDSIEVITYVIKQSGYCNFCNQLTGDKYYVFCDSKCRDFWYSLNTKKKGEQVGEYDIDKELYVKWFEDKTLAIEAMTKEDVENRIKEIYYIEFYCKREGAMLSQRWDKLRGRHGIPPWLKEDRDKLITDPNIKPNWDGEPRKKEKKPKQDLLGSLLNLDIAELRQAARVKVGGNPIGYVTPDLPNKKQTLNDALDEMVAGLSPKPAIAKPSEDEMKAKAEAIKEKLRLAKEKREKGE